MLYSGEIIAVHINTEGIRDRRRVEETVVRELTKYLRGRCTEAVKVQLDELLSGLQLVAVRQTNSLLWYIYRESVSAMDELIQLLESGRLQNIIISVFNFLTTTHSQPIISVKIHDDEQFCDCYQRLSSVQVRHKMR